MRLTLGKALFLRRGAQTFCRGKAPAAMRVCASHPGKPYFSVEGRKLFARKRRRRPCEFAPHTPESLIPPSRGANFSPGKGACGCEGLRLGAGSLRLIPGKPYSSVEGRKPIAGKRRRRLCEFAPHTRESLISSLRGANFLPGRGASGRVSLRLTPGQALFQRRGAQTFPLEKAPAAV